MQKNKTGFTLIEIITSVIILTIGIFGIYQMLNINTNNLNNYNNIKQAKELLQNTKECIKYIGFNNFYSSSQTGYSINFGTDNKGCFTGDINDLTGVILDNKTYFITGIIEEKSANKINWNLSVSTQGIKSQTGSFILYK